MSQSKRRRTGKRTERQQGPEVKIVYRSTLNKGAAILIAAVVVVLILVILGISYYPTYIAPYRIDVITVDNVAIRMDYFVKRTWIAGSDPMTMLTNLAQEEIVKMEAPKYGIEISDEEIDQQLRNIAAGENSTISEGEFKEWYRQQLNNTKLSNSQYREIVATGLRVNYIHQILAMNMPSEVEQIHLYAMLLATEKEAEDMRTRLLTGEDFASLATEFSLDASSRDKGGDLGWTPQGVMDPQIEHGAWEMSPGDISEPIPIYNTEDVQNPAIIGYYVLWLAEKADSRTIDEQYIPTMQNLSLEKWFTQAMQEHEIKYHGFNNGFDSETYYWVNLQISKLNSGNQDTSGGQ
jgi:foldase protein PrsA